MPETPTDPQNTPDNSGQEPKTYTEEYVRGLREEAAGHRVAKNQAVEAAKVETRAEVVKEYEPQLADRDTKITGLESDLSARDLELLKLKAVLAAKIPTGDVLDVVDLVQGTDDESVSKSVERVKSLIGKSPSTQRLVDPSQGAGSHVPLNGDPIVNMLKQAVNG